MSIISYNVNRPRRQPPQQAPIEVKTTETTGTPTGYVIACDLGQSRDWTAVVVNERVEAERVERRRYTQFEQEHLLQEVRRPLIRHNLVRLHRYPLGTPYPEIARSLRNAMTQLAPMRDAPELILDATGVGAAVSDAVKELGVPHRRVTITGGVNTSGTYNDMRIAKKALASLLDVCLSEQRVKVPSSDPLATTLISELQAFTVRVTASGNETFSALREKDHDDLVLAAALAIWAAEKRPKPAQWTNLSHVFQR